MAESTAARSIPQSVRITGWVAAALGAMGVIGGAMGVVVSALMPPLPFEEFDLPWGAVGNFVFRNVFKYYALIAVASAAVSVLLLVAGIRLAQGLEWARRTLVVLLWLWAAYYVGFYAVWLSAVVGMGAHLRSISLEGAGPGP